jgi:hypothetical protein
MRQVVRVALALAALLVLWPAGASAQEGQIAGVVRDSSGGVMPGVTVEVTSPALIEKVRSATTDSNGQYRITNLPVGTYTVTFSLEGFSRQQRENIELTSGFTAPVNATMSVGQITDTVTVTAESPTVDVQNARQAITFEGEQIRDLPTNNNVNSLLALTPGINSGYQPGTQSGVCSGGVGVFCNPGVTAFNQGGQVGGDSGNLSQGRVMVDGQVVNSGGNLPIVGAAGGYTADIANAQEINIQLSGALGESETGGASINIIPRTGGNRYAGNVIASYTRRGWFDQNNSAYEAPELGGIEPEFQAVLRDHDVSGAFGGPIMRDRLWFYSVARDQRIRKLPVANDFWPNLNEGEWGFNYQPDRSQPRVEYENIWRNVNARITWQASQRNKFNIFWDEQDFCQDPCLGVVSVFTSPESWWSVQTKPNRLAQVSWTNPWTNRVLLEAGVTTTLQKYHTDEHREYRNPREIPRIVETCPTNVSASPIPAGGGTPAVLGCTAGGDEVAGRVNGFAGNGFFALTSGSLNSNLPGGGAETLDSQNYRMRASASYVTGTHHAKIGYDGAYYNRDQTPQANDLRMTYNYSAPLQVAGGVVTAPCLTSPDPLACGNTSLQFPTDPFNRSLRPVPATVTFNTGVGTVTDTVQYHAFYAQDQWTLRRLTVTGSLRYDHAASKYGSTCVGPDVFVADGYCTPELDGVSFNDISPRWGVTYDLFGTGRTSLKWNMGKGLNAATISGIYANANPARRTVNSLTRNWTDTNGDRVVGCNLLDPADTRDGCGTFTSSAANRARFGTDPSTNPVGVNSSQCGATTEGGAIIIPQSILDYCSAYGESLLDGWGKRRYEWQLGIGIQHEILPRLSGEFTYNRRTYYNLTLDDEIGLGCDLFNGAVAYETCRQSLLNYQSGSSYQFYSLRAPADPRLPGGGGYLITGLATGAVNAAGVATAAGGPDATTINELLEYAYNGFDTNFVWRGPGGLRVNGGSSTYRTNRDDCGTLNDFGTNPDASPGQNPSSPLKGREGAPYMDGCINRSPFQTRLNGSAAYTIPWIDVLVSTVFQSFPGVERSANMTFSKNDVIWNSEAAFRANLACTGFAAFAGNGCLGTSRNASTVAWNLLNNNELFGERITLFDLKFAKNVRFANKRATIGVDIYNLFNSDAIEDYEDAYTPDNPSTPQNENEWGQPAGLVAPRFVRLQLQFNF